jgi:Ser-tRNA(Ala) deacylase AlaX
MKRLYWENTYLMNHKAKITAIGQDEQGDYIRVDETIFHPQGGGQPSDEGAVNGIKVTKLKDLRDINEINHYVENISQFKVGDTVELSIDGEKRLECAALHTAGHITGGVLRTSYSYTDQVSANHFPKQSKVEFKLEGRVNKESIQEKINVIIANAQKVTEDYNEDGLRCIKIEDLWTEPCSGTHVSDTSQISDYEVRKLETKKGRLTIGYNAQYRCK